MQRSVRWCGTRHSPSGCARPRCAVHAAPQGGDANRGTAVPLERAVNGRFRQARRLPSSRRILPFCHISGTGCGPRERGCAGYPVFLCTTNSHNQISRARTATTAGPESSAVLSFRWSGYGAMSTGRQCARERREKPPRKCRVGKMVSNQKVQGGRQQVAEGFRSRRSGVLKAPIFGSPYHICWFDNFLRPSQTPQGHI